MEGRIGRFLRAARTLMWMQLVAALLAVSLAIWAVLAVRDLAAERDRLQERVAQLESRPVETNMLVSPEPALPEGNSVASVPTPPTTTPVPTNQVAPAPVQTESEPQPQPQPLPPPVRTPSPRPTPTPTPLPPTMDPSPTRGDDTPVRPPGRPRPTDCANAAPTDPRCRAGRWTVVPGATVLRPVIRRPTTDRPQSGNRQEPIR